MTRQEFDKEMVRVSSISGVINDNHEIEVLWKMWEKGDVKSLRVIIDLGLDYWKLETRKRRHYVS